MNEKDINKQFEEIGSVLADFQDKLSVYPEEVLPLFADELKNDAYKSLKKKERKALAIKMFKEKFPKLYTFLIELDLAMEGMQDVIDDKLTELEETQDKLDEIEQMQEEIQQRKDELE